MPTAKPSPLPVEVDRFGNGLSPPSKPIKTVVTISEERAAEIRSRSKPIRARAPVTKRKSTILANQKLGQEKDPSEAGPDERTLQGQVGRETPFHHTGLSTSDDPRHISTSHAGEIYVYTTQTAVTYDQGSGEPDDHRVVNLQPPQGPDSYHPDGTQPGKEQGQSIGMSDSSNDRSLAQPDYSGGEAIYTNKSSDSGKNVDVLDYSSTKEFHHLYQTSRSSGEASGQSGDSPQHVNYREREPYETSGETNMDSSPHDQSGDSPQRVNYREREPYETSGETDMDSSPHDQSGDSPQHVNYREREPYETSGESDMDSSPHDQSGDSPQHVNYREREPYETSGESDMDSSPHDQSGDSPQHVNYREREPYETSGETDMDSSPHDQSGDSPQRVNYRKHESYESSGESDESRSESIDSPGESSGERHWG